MSIIVILSHRYVHLDSLTLWYNHPAWQENREGIRYILRERMSRWSTSQAVAILFTCLNYKVLAFAMSNVFQRVPVQVNINGKIIAMIIRAKDLIERPWVTGCPTDAV